MDKNTIVKYQKNEDSEQLVIVIKRENVCQTISEFALLKEKIVTHLTFFDQQKKFKISLSGNQLIKHSTYAIDGNVYQFLFSQVSFNYMYHFILKLYLTSHSNINHIHIDFRNEMLPEFSFVVLIEDEELVKYQFERPPTD